MQRTRKELVAFIEDFLLGEGGPWDWDDFISVPIGDPDLEAIRTKCNTLRDLYPPNGKEYCNEEGRAVLRRILADLRASSAAPVRQK